MKISSTRFGELEAEPDSVLEFPRGLPGFPKCTRFHLFHEEKDDPMVFWLQSLDDPEVSIPVVQPARFNISYEIELSDEETELLAVENPADLAIIVVISEGRSRVPLPNLKRVNINPHVTNPIIIDTRSRRGMQKALSDIQYGVTIRATLRAPKDEATAGD